MFCLFIIDKGNGAIQKIQLFRVGQFHKKAPKRRSQARLGLMKSSLGTVTIISGNVAEVTEVTPPKKLLPNPAQVTYHLPVTVANVAESRCRLHHRRRLVILVPIAIRHPARRRARREDDSCLHRRRILFDDQCSRGLEAEKNQSIMKCDMYSAGIQN